MCVHVSKTYRFLLYCPVSVSLSLRTFLGGPTRFSATETGTKSSLFLLLSNPNSFLTGRGEGGMEAGG